MIRRRNSKRFGNCLWKGTDFDDLGVDADKQTLSPEDLAKMMDFLKTSPGPILHFSEEVGGRSGNGADDGPGDLRLRNRCIAGILRLPD